MKFFNALIPLVAIGVIRITAHPTVAVSKLVARQQSIPGVPITVCEAINTPIVLPSNLNGILVFADCGPGQSCGLISNLAPEVLDPLNPLKDPALSELVELISGGLSLPAGVGFCTNTTS